MTRSIKIEKSEVEREGSDTDSRERETVGEREERRADNFAAAVGAESAERRDA